MEYAGICSSDPCHACHRLGIGRNLVNPSLGAILGRWENLIEVDPQGSTVIELWSFQNLMP